MSKMKVGKIVQAKIDARAKAESTVAKRYILVGGQPFRGYTGTLTYTGLRLVGSSDTTVGISKLMKDNYEDCGSLVLIIDTVTGQEANV